MNRESKEMVSQIDTANNTEGRLYEFTLSAGTGHSVFLSGSFNDWNPETAPMKDADGSGRYRCTVCLQAGYYEYKFVVDDEWILDEENPNFAPNDFGTLNSVLAVG